MIDKISGVNNQIQSTTKVQQKNDNSEFSQILSQALKTVNEQQKNVEQMSDDYAKGKISNIHELIVEAEKASISLRLTVEVRNRIVDAYREIMRMQF
ncbi:MAG: flagellar hook-basal body complex protein FliE [Fervidobacterium sp.]|jgi:flagellar hook-basal body complex protein FliE